MSETDDWITTDTARELTGYSREYLRRLIRNERIKARKFGTIWQVSRSDLLRYFNEAKQSEDVRTKPRPDKQV